jgi:hypothetical protein
MKCTCKRCSNEWKTKQPKRGINYKKPKCCPECKSYAWDKPYQEKKPKEDGPELIKMKCSVCSKVFEDGETVFRAQEGKNIGGRFVFTEKLQQGLYCDSCMVAPDQLPFLCDK